MTLDEVETYSPRGPNGAWLTVILNLIFWGGVAVLITRCDKPPAVPAEPPCDEQTIALKFLECAARVRAECSRCEVPSVCEPCQAEDECNRWAEDRMHYCLDSGALK